MDGRAFESVGFWGTFRRLLNGVVDMECHWVWRGSATEDGSGDEYSGEEDWPRGILAADSNDACRERAVLIDANAV